MYKLDSLLTWLMGGGGGGGEVQSMDWTTGLTFNLKKCIVPRLLESGNHKKSVLGRLTC